MNVNIWQSSRSWAKHTNHEHAPNSFYFTGYRFISHFVFFFFSGRPWRESLLANLTLGAFILLTVDGNGLVLSPLVLNERSILRLARIKLGESVTVNIRGDLEGGNVVLATNDESSLDDRVVGLAINGGSSENVLARTLKSVEETTYTIKSLEFSIVKGLSYGMLTDQVVGHECHFQLFVVLIINLPQGVIFRAVVLPKPWHGNRTDILVGELALPVVEDHGWLGKSFKGVLCLWGRLLLLLCWGSSSGGLGGRGRLGSFLLLWGDILQRLLNEGGVRYYSLENWLVDNGLVPSGGGWVRQTPFLAENVLESAVAKAGSEDISEGDTLTNKEGIVGEVLLKDIKCL